VGRKIIVKFIHHHPRKYIHHVVEAMRFYLCPEHGILKSAVQRAILPLPRAGHSKKCSTLCNFYLCPEQGIIKVQYIIQFYLCPEQGIIKVQYIVQFLPLSRAGHYKKCSTSYNFTSAQSRALEKVQFSVQFYLCPELGIIKSAMLAPFPSTGVDESRTFHFLKRPSLVFSLRTSPNIPAGYDENQNKTKKLAGPGGGFTLGQALAQQALVESGLPHAGPYSTKSPLLLRAFTLHV
jgi:hypothetical protein